MSGSHHDRSFLAIGAEFGGRPGGGRRQGGQNPSRPGCGVARDPYGNCLTRYPLARFISSDCVHPKSRISGMRRLGWFRGGRTEPGDGRAGRPPARRNVGFARFGRRSKPSDGTSFPDGCWMRKNGPCNGFVGPFSLLPTRGGPRLRGNDTTQAHQGAVVPLKEQWIAPSHSKPGFRARGWRIGSGMTVARERGVGSSVGDGANRPERWGGLGGWACPKGPNSYNKG